ncbi:capsular biosynthesis protein [Marinobacterium sedimentorum]|uniref:capsular biosynthesis protein n=1 Tax=Marinobacterium sedimentorum TaxID=2927804 RepID=UPI0020C65026|nr:capsular biosynthesis protein [Marinobacterium sedimentorum]MCP8686261.1 capsular biosynthesis protein [Marinobacterium sedimentorum]
MKVILSEFSDPAWVRAVERMQQARAWQPVLWVAEQNVKMAVESAFPECRFLNRVDAIRMAPPAGVDTGRAVVGPELLNATAYYQLQAIKMMARMDNDGASFTAEQRMDYFHNLLSFWQVVLDELQPDLVVFLESPHVIYDYALYALCCFRNIETRMFVRTKIGDYVAPTARFEHGPESISRAMAEINAAGYDTALLQRSLPDAMVAEVERIKGDFASGMETTAKGQIDHYNKRAERLVLKHYGNLLKDIVRLKLDWLRKTLSGDTLHKSTYLKSPQAASPREWMTKYQYKKAKVQGRRLRYGNEQSYSRYAIMPDLAAPYIYFPLHFQPERSTCPDGGWFVDQRLAIANLSAVLPAGWKIYVREHPASFIATSHAGRGHMLRPKGFYDDLVALGNVELVGMGVDPFSLTDNAKAVATVTGTAGWESVVRGRPALVFGAPWYRDCPGVYHADVGAEELSRIIENIADGNCVAEDEIYRFLLAVHRSCIACRISTRIRTQPLDTPDNVEKLVALLTGSEAVCDA